jgi:NAD+ kinase
MEPCCERSGLVADAGVPLVALNAGQLGYLADVAPERAEWALDELAAGRGRLEERMRVQATVTPAAGDPQTPISIRTGLNEVVVERSLTGHTLRLRVYLDGEFFTSYVTDGMVVATPTGSTAYALSVRGPIVAPTHRALVMVPVAPHLLFDRAMVLEASSTVELEVVGHRSAVLSVDGQSGTEVAPGGRVCCSMAPVPARFIRFEQLRFHDVLKRKFSLADR